MGLGITIVAGLALLLHLPAHPALAQSPSPHVPAHAVLGTIHALGADDGSVELITGVGHALRLVQIKVEPKTRVESGGTTLHLRDLQCGDIVRAECLATGTGHVATFIERVHRP
jgi:hypothetical protein